MTDWQTIHPTDQPTDLPTNQKTDRGPKGSYTSYNENNSIRGKWREWSIENGTSCTNNRIYTIVCRCIMYTVEYLRVLSITHPLDHWLNYSLTNISLQDVRYGLLWYYASKGPSVLPHLPLTIKKNKNVNQLKRMVTRINLEILGTTSNI